MPESTEQDEYYFLELFDTFKEASQRAKSISAQYDGLARVKREDGKFKILVPLWVKDHILNPPPPEDDEIDYSDTSEQDSYDPIDEERERVRAELLSEIYEDADDWSRSSESGWFYGDDDAT